MEKSTARGSPIGQRHCPRLTLRTVAVPRRGGDALAGSSQRSPQEGRVGGRRILPRRGSRGGRARGVLGLPRPLRPSRWTLPITALRVMPPESAQAIWLALKPSRQRRESVWTRSSVQADEVMAKAFGGLRAPAARLPRPSLRLRPPGRRARRRAQRNGPADSRQRGPFSARGAQNGISSGSSSGRLWASAPATESSSCWRRFFSRNCSTTRRRS